MMLQNKIIILNPYFFFRALTCLFDVPLSIPIVEWHIHILLTWMLQYDSVPTFPDSFFFFLFRFFSSFLQPRFSYLIFENQDRGRTQLLFRGITLFRLFPICRRQVAFYVVMEPADSIARMVTGSAHWLAEMLGKERVHIGRTKKSQIQWW